MSGLLSHRMLVALLIGLLATAGNACAQTIWYVDDDAPGDPNAGDPTVSDPNEDGSAAHPFDAIGEGIGAAVDGDTVLVLDGEYTGVGNRDLDFGGRLITARSANGAAACVIDCQDAGRGFYFHNGETAAAVVEGFTITNGSANYGGGMYNNQSSPTVTHCTFSGNLADRGGGMCNENSNPTVTWCTFSGNAADWGGGGGMYNGGGSPTVTRCTFSGNTATYYYGGGMANAASSPTVTQCTFNGNRAGLGSGMYNAEGSTPTVTHCTFSGNTAGGGGGMFNGASSPTVTNSILWNDTPDEICSVNSSPVVTYSDVQDDDPNDGTIYPGTGNIDDDPLFMDADGPDDDPNTWQDNDYHLLPTSPCVNAGDNAAAVVFSDTTTGAGTQTSVTVADPTPYAIDDEIEYDGDGVLRTVTALDPNSGQVSFDDPLAAPSEPNAPIVNYGWGDIDGDDRIFDSTVDMGADEFVPAQLMATEPPADGSLPKTQNNVILCVFDRSITLPASGNPLVIQDMTNGCADVSDQFVYAIDPDDPNGRTLEARETDPNDPNNHDVLPDMTWYQVNSAPSWTAVQPFQFEVCTLVGDCNPGGRVTTADYGCVKEGLGQRGDVREDLNGSGRVTTADYGVVKGTLGSRAPAKPALCP